MIMFPNSLLAISKLGVEVRLQQMLSGLSFLDAVGDFKSALRKGLGLGFRAELENSLAASIKIHISKPASSFYMKLDS